MDALYKPTPFAEQVDIVPGLDELAIAADMNKHANPCDSPVFKQAMHSVVSACTAWGQYGGMFVNSERGDMPRLVIPTPVAISMQEAGGAFTPAMTPELFKVPEVLRGTVDLVPDMSYLLWMRSVSMKDESETRDEWDYNPQYVLMKDAGQIKFGTWAGQEMQMTNEEYGAGVNISWTWFETNKFRIKFASLAPKFKWTYFDDIATAIYTGVQTVFTNTLVTHGLAATNNVIVDINQAIVALQRTVNYNGKETWANARVAVLAPPEFQQYLNQSLKLSGYLPTSATFLQTPTVIYTTKLPAAAPATIYVVVLKEEQNEFATRVALTAHGPVDDIETFSSMIAWRGAYGANLNIASAIVLTFTPAAATFSVAGPIEVSQ